MRSLLIDPFQRAVHQIQCPDSKKWPALCDCQYFDQGYLGLHQGRKHYVWVDDNGLMRDPVYPTWVWRDRSNPFAGYGIVLAVDAAGGAVSTDMPVDYALDRIAWEFWEMRLEAVDYFDQISRLYF